MAAQVRNVLVTSIGSGVGRAIVDAARLSANKYRVIGMDCQEIRADVVKVPLTQSVCEFRSAVLAVARSVPESLILPGRDPDAAALAPIAPELAASGAVFPLGPLGAVLASQDKARTGRVLGLGDDFASTATSFAKAVGLGNRLGWPLVVKPRRGSASADVRMAADLLELSDLMTTNDVAQELLPLLDHDRRPWDRMSGGGQDGEYSLQLVLGRHSEMIGWFASRNSLTIGRPVVVEVLPESVAAPALTRLLPAMQRIGATGCWNFQGRMAPSGIRYFEVNPRTTGITGLRAALGFNEIDLLYESFVLAGNLPVHAAVQPTVVDATVWTAPPAPRPPGDGSDSSATRLAHPVTARTAPGVHALPLARRRPTGSRPANL